MVTKTGADTVNLSVMARPEFVAWLDRLAEFERLSRSATVERSIVAFAQMTGFQEPPPPRTSKP